MPISDDERLQAQREEIRNRLLRSEPIFVDPSPSLAAGPGALDILSWLGTALSAVGGAKIAFEMIKLWVDDRKGRKIVLKKGDLEVEVQGGMNEKAIEGAIDRFKKLERELGAKEIKILEP